MLISSYRILLRVFLSIYLVFVKVLSRRTKVRAQAVPGGNVRVLLTGTFYSDQWIDTHLRPLSVADSVQSVQMVACKKGPEIEGVEYIIPSAGMQKIFGAVPARLFLFCFVALRTKPNVIGGFHLLINGLVSLILGKIVGAATLYICGGGAREVLGGGYLTENKIFKRIRGADTKIEKLLLEAVSYFDAVVVMGRGALNYFRAHGVSSPIYIQAGGFNADKYFCAKSDARFDVIFVGRISRVKRIDVFVEAIRQIKEAYFPGVKAVVLGDGPERALAGDLVEKYGLVGNIYFAGWQSNVWDWLQDSRLFVLTSESEGLSQAMIQAMMCGLPAVVSDVGDLSDLVESGQNGYLIPELNAHEYAKSCAGLLSDASKYREFRAAALRDSARFELNNAAKIWDAILVEIL